MKITIDRFTSDNDAIVSRVLVDGQFVCFGLENERTNDETSTQTRIPTGTYPVKLSLESESNAYHQIHFPDMHMGMLQIRDATDFKSALIHTVAPSNGTQSSGCLLVGDQALTRTDEMKLSQSENAYQTFYPMVVEAAVAGELSITYEDNDRGTSDLESLIDEDFKVDANISTHDAKLLSSILKMMQRYELAVWRASLFVVVIMLLVAML